MTKSVAAIHPLELEPGSKFKTPNAVYRVIEPLGKGGNSIVYLVVQIYGEWPGLLFAMKIFVNVEKPDRRDRFENEIRFLQENFHPAIMKVIDTGSFIDPAGLQDVTLRYVIAEYLPKTLRSLMGGSLSMAEKVAYTLQLMSALMHLEQRNPPVVHRDIKPENIFIRGRSCILGDFGLLKELYGEEDVAEVDAQQLEQQQTRPLRFDIEESSGVRFPYLYPTPDLLRYCKSKPGEYELSAKSDVFQLGLVLAEMFTEIIPMKARSKPYDPLEMLPLAKIGGSLARGQAIGSLISQMLEVDIDRRPYASQLFDSWEGIFFEIAKDSLQLDGRVLK